MYNYQLSDMAYTGTWPGHSWTRAGVAGYCERCRLRSKTKANRIFYSRDGKAWTPEITPCIRRRRR